MPQKQKVRAETIADFFYGNRKTKGLGFNWEMGITEATKFSQGLRTVMSVRITAMDSRADSKVEEGHEAEIFFVDASADEFDNRDVIPWLAPGVEPVAEHEA